MITPFNIEGLSPAPSPENKDPDSAIFATLPKVSLHEHLSHAAQTPAELTAAVVDAVQALVDDHVVYAELRLAPEAFSFAPEEAVAAAVAGLEQASQKVAARLLITGMRHSGQASAMAQLAIDSREKFPQVVGFDLAGDPEVALGEQADVAALAQQLRETYLPFEVHIGGSEELGQHGPADLEAAVRAGVTRLTHPVALVDDFTAGIEGIVPGPLSAWVRDRGIPVTFSPLLEETMGLVDEVADHPLPLLQQLGFNCTIAAGQPAAGTLTDQFTALADTFDYGLEEFFDLTARAVQASFATQEERQHLLETVILPAYEEYAEQADESTAAQGDGANSDLS